MAENEGGALTLKDGIESLRLEGNSERSPFVKVEVCEVDKVGYDPLGLKYEVEASRLEERIDIDPLVAVVEATGCEVDTLGFVKPAEVDPLGSMVVVLRTVVTLAEVDGGVAILLYEALGERSGAAAGDVEVRSSDNNADKPEIVVEMPSPPELETGVP